MSLLTNININNTAIQNLKQNANFVNACFSHVLTKLLHLKHEDFTPTLK